MFLEKLRHEISLRNFFAFHTQAVVANMLLSMLISMPLLRSGRYGSVAAVIFDISSFISHYFLLNLLTGLVSFIFSAPFPRRLKPLLTIIPFSCLQIILFADTKIFSMFHYHINPFVWNVLTTEGVSDSVILGKETVAVFAGVVVLILLAETAIVYFIRRQARRRDEKGSRPAVKRYLTLFILLLCLMLLEKGIYAYSDLMNNTGVTRNARLFPLYQPLTIKRFAMKYLHIKVNREEKFTVAKKSDSLRYPKEPLKFDEKRDKRFNVIVIVLDGLRFDMLDPGIMPNTWAFAGKNLVFRNHYSGGNGTRFGIFSLFYGIQGTYWQNFLAQRISPVMLDTLGSKGYDFRILSSTLLTFPEFRKTAFVRIPDKIEDTFSTEDVAERDRIITDNFKRYISTRDREKPFFSFVFFDSTHQPYLYPKEFEKFSPVIGTEINYFRDTSKKEIYKVRNRYKNAAYYDDSLVKEILLSLRKNGLYENSMVVITGDHGEEFLEDGYFGHTSSFDNYQTHTTFVMRYPGAGHRIIDKLTTHADLVPTVMESIGCTSPPGQYSQGISLLSPERHPYIISSNWDTAALIDEDSTIVFSTELYRFSSFQVYKRSDYRPVENSAGAVRKRVKLLVDETGKMSEFYK